MQDEATEPSCDPICVAHGYGLKIYVRSGHLVVEDGIFDERRTRRYNGATSGLQRVVVIGHAGFVTLESLRWIRDVGASFAQIGRDGEIIAMSSVDRLHATRLRRAQAMAADSSVGLGIMRTLVAAKVEAQLARVGPLEELWPAKPNGGRGQVHVDAIICRELAALSACNSLVELRAREAVAGRWYWQTLAALPVRFDSRWDKTVPDHWRRAGARTSQPSGFKSSRKAATPFHALLNYAYAILETEATVALQTHGFDPALGVLHSDKRYRGSLAHDVMEPVRPDIDGLVIDWLASRPLERGDVHETREGVCRIGATSAQALCRFAVETRTGLDRYCRALAEGLLAGGRPAVPARRRNQNVAGKGANRRFTPRTA